MKKYKTEKMNQQVREIVRDYMSNNPFGSIKYWSNEEFEDSLVPHYGISHGIAIKVREIVRADGYHDEIARKVWGFDKYTA